MLRLDSTMTLQAVLATPVATVQPQATASFSDKTTSGYAGGSQRTALNGMTDVNIVNAPAVGAIRDVDTLSLFNRDSASVTVSVKYDIAGVDSLILTVTLATLETLVYTHADGWRVLSANGGIKTTSDIPVQTSLQYQDEGTNLGTPGTVNTVNFVGGGVTASRVSNTVTVSVPTPPAVAAGGSGDVQYNSAGLLGAESAFNYNASTNTLTVEKLTATGLVDISGASAGQIKFPAVQNPSADSNVLDDYEEGTFTVTATASGGGTITLDLATCSYTKIGRNVNVYGIIRVSAISAPTGIMFLDGLPFTVGDWAGLAVYIDALAASAIQQIIGYFGQGTTRVSLFKYAAGITTGLAGDIAVNSVFMLSGSYRI